MTTQPDVQKLGEDYLKHFGKVGMKWGHRSNKSTSSSKTTSSRGRKIGASIKGAAIAATSKKGMAIIGSVLAAVGYVTLAELSASSIAGSNESIRKSEKEISDLNYKDLERKLEISRLHDKYE